MERLFSQVVVALCLSVAGCNGFAQDSQELSKKFAACSRIGGDEVEGRLCYVDSVALISNPSAFCFLTVSTFGYVKNVYRGTYLFPDQARAEREVLPSSLLIADTMATDAIKSELGASQAGVYVTVTGELFCPESKKAEAGLWAGELRNIRHLSTVDLDDKGAFLRERILRPKNLQEAH